MSTRSFIGFYDPKTRSTPGVYHHSDGVGNMLYHLAQMYEDLTILQDFLFDHPSGYSFLLCWSGAPEDLIGYDQWEAEYTEYKKHLDWATAYETMQEKSYGKYYDGVRADPDAKVWNISKVLDSRCAYAYVIYPEYRLMGVFKVGTKDLIKIGVVDFDAPIPDILKD